MLPFLIEMLQTHNSHLTKNLPHGAAESEIMEFYLVYQNRKDGFSPLRVMFLVSHNVKDRVCELKQQEAWETVRYSL